MISGAGYIILQIEHRENSLQARYDGTLSHSSDSKVEKELKRLVRFEMDSWKHSGKHLPEDMFHFAKCVAEKYFDTVFVLESNYEMINGIA